MTGVTVHWQWNLHEKTGSSKETKTVVIKLCCLHLICESVLNIVVSENLYIIYRCIQIILFRDIKSEHSAMFIPISVNINVTWQVE